MKTITLNWTDLESAFERNSPNVESFLNLLNGDVEVVSPENANYKEQRAAVREGGSENYLRIEAVPAREQYKWMENFITNHIKDEPLKERLLIACDGKGAFRRFKDVLLNYPEAREGWFTYRSNLLRWHMQEWLSKVEIEGQYPAPWGRIEEPKEEEGAADGNSAGGVKPTPQQKPGDVLRHRAKELINAVPAVELPAAMAFLEFLKSRTGQ